ncbi:MAG: PASTA domain-containing protein [Acidobacteriota bacterium]
MTLRGASLLVLKVAAIAASSALLLLISFYLSVRVLIFGNEITVPDLRDRTTEESRQLLEREGLYLVTEMERYDPAVPQGRIISQMPPAGASIKTKRKVKVVVSRGTETLEVPDLQGESERRAVLEIDRLGLRVGKVARVRSGIPPDRIVAQDPQPGSQIFRGDRISLLVSRGPGVKIYVMPDLSGRLLARAREVLDAAGLRIGQTTPKASLEPAGTILSQFPLAGYPVSRRDPITVVVSGGSSV